MWAIMHGRLRALGALELLLPGYVTGPGLVKVEEFQCPDGKACSEEDVAGTSISTSFKAQNACMHVVELPKDGESAMYFFRNEIHSCNDTHVTISEYEDDGCKPSSILHKWDVRLGELHEGRKYSCLVEVPEVLYTVSWTDAGCKGKSYRRYRPLDVCQNEGVDRSLKLTCVDQQLTLSEHTAFDCGHSGHIEVKNSTDFHIETDIKYNTRGECNEIEEHGPENVWGLPKSAQIVSPCQSWEDPFWWQIKIGIAIAVAMIGDQMALKPFFKWLWPEIDASKKKKAEEAAAAAAADASSNKDKKKEKESKKKK
eukprot:gnl/TRDRNA2_/TRDRNA2_173140_c0_seq1.p1 gnl/TRDRNA2_/TRDRNA2_173140_c0~~gnl/TRDRNA2_/TRDRNA2_173140_c0_seq1.p1  ORF type:complete len:312 (+),score=69.47 gnl/TRDRNA2_/TRDRNA2_173140_c0_seq1:33-968(+)